MSFYYLFQYGPRVPTAASPSNTNSSSSSNTGSQSGTISTSLSNTNTNTTMGEQCFSQQHIQNKCFSLSFDYMLQFELFSTSVIFMKKYAYVIKMQILNSNVSSVDEINFK